MRNDIQQHHTNSEMAPTLLCQPTQNTDQVINKIVKGIRRIIISNMADPECTESKQILRKLLRILTRAKTKGSDEDGDLALDIIEAIQNQPHEQIYNALALCIDFEN